MKAKPTVLRVRASQDIEDAIAYYLSENAADATMRLVDELERAFMHISRNPGTGSMRHAHALDLPGLRFWPLSRFPHLIFYFEAAESIDVWRVLHGRRDIPEWIQGADLAS